MALRTDIQNGTPTKVSTTSPADSTTSSTQYNSPIALNPSRVQHLRGEGFGQSSLRTASDSDLLTFAGAAGIVPDGKETERREAVVEAFCSMIGASRERGSLRGLASKPTGGSNEFLSTQRSCSVKLILVLDGVNAIGVHFPESDINCIVAGNISPSSFWAVVEENPFRIGNDAKDTNALTPVVLDRYVKDAVVRMVTLRMDGCVLRVRYFLATVLAEKFVSITTEFLGAYAIFLSNSWSRLVDSMDDDNVLQVPGPGPSMDLLGACRDRKRLYDSYPSFPSFQLAFRLVKLYCTRRGIYGPHMGFLGDTHLEVMMRLMAKRLPDSSSAYEFIKEFFRMYSSFDWASQTLSVTGPRVVYERSPQEPMVILSPECAAVNVAASASLSTRQTIIKELCLAYDSLAEGAPLEEIWASEATSFAAFLSEYPGFAKIDVGYWGASCTGARALIGYIESWLTRVSLLRTLLSLILMLISSFSTSLNSSRSC